MNVKRLFLTLVTLLTLTVTAFAGSHPEANFGIYGIQHFSTVAEYQQNYVGQVVKYLPQKEGGAYMDTEYFQKAGGKFNTEYIITKISGNNQRMTFLLTEKDSKNKVKMIVNNQEEYYSFGKYCYCITPTYSIPLFLSEKFNADKSKYIGKVYPESSDSPVQLEVTDVIMRAPEGSSYSDHKYPVAYYVLKDKKDGKVTYYDAAFAGDLNDIGITFTNPKFKCTYTVVNVFTKKESTYTSPYYKMAKYYTVKNSMTGTTKEVNASYAKISSFSGDDSGRFLAELTKVEKPSNPSVRYGKTTTVTNNDDKVTRFSYVDNFIDILIFTTLDQFNFVLKNVSNSSLKVVWNEAVFVDVDGSTSKIMHSGIKYSQREADQPASTIIAGAKLDDLAAPTSKIYYSESLKKWTSYSLYSNAKIKETNQTIKLMLPIQVKDVVNEYIFEFGLTYVYDHPELLAEE